ncbi:hypothetical protein O4J56_13470 [Nocardiopsis sp. RSe5-2]|uniref:Uncharacterized protein n=1 Tax=Nocardiopsis endophytica TaxID=3018445 RepID=A0ABT4U3Y0_9ACTN|nr:hypothetical protein [Nocardiopsis endophytica]MDA2811645.1 hypothetical protein [Nocardiopsis endophytica]
MSVEPYSVQLDAGNGHWVIKSGTRSLVPRQRGASRYEYSPTVTLRCCNCTRVHLDVPHDLAEDLFDRHAEDVAGA